MKSLNSSMLPAFVVVLAGLAAAQKPQVANAKIQELSAAGGLRVAVDSIAQKQSGALWIGYRIPAAPKERTMCCFDSDAGGWRSQYDRCCSGCRMETERGTSVSTTTTSSDFSCSGPEPLPFAFVFLRLEEKRIGRVRVYSTDCRLDFAGFPLFWLEDVKPEQSIDLLTGVALTDGTDSDSRWNKPSRDAVMAIAVHDTPAADAALEKLIQPSQPLRVRENVAFWLGVERGKKGLELLRKYVKTDSDVQLRKKGTFAFSQSKEPEALTELIGMARNDSSPSVRGEAIFWLAQIGGRKEAEQITAAIENDPETEVKKRAVFALSQMHGGDGVPLLIHLAKTNRNPAVRKQAIFWLGQSRDTRALDFLEEILTK